MHPVRFALAVQLLSIGCQSPGRTIPVYTAESPEVKGVETACSYTARCGGFDDAWKKGCIENGISKLDEHARSDTRRISLLDEEAAGHLTLDRAAVSACLALYDAVPCGVVLPVVECP